MPCTVEPRTNTSPSSLPAGYEPSQITMDPLDNEVDQEIYQTQIVPYLAEQEADRLARPAVETYLLQREQERKKADLDRVLFNLNMYSIRHTKGWYHKQLVKERRDSIMRFSRFLKRVGGHDIVGFQENDHTCEKRKSMKSKRGTKITLSQLLGLRRSLELREKRKLRRESSALKAWLEENGSEARKRRAQEKEQRRVLITGPVFNFSDLAFRGKQKALTADT
jgi:hypothetical protein